MWGTVWTLASGAIVGLLAWFATEFLARPLRTFFDLRKEAKRRMILYWNAPTSDSYYRSLNGWSDVETYQLDEGRRQLEDIGAQLATPSARASARHQRASVAQPLRGVMR
jgi:hypothetical protein